MKNKEKRKSSKIMEYLLVIPLLVVVLTITGCGSASSDSVSSTSDSGTETDSAVQEETNTSTDSAVNDENDSTIDASSDSTTDDSTSDAATDGTEDLDLATKNAYMAAKNYLSFTAFSRQGLIDQLSSEYGDGYTVEQATAAVDLLEQNGEVDWNEQAVNSAKSYLETTSFSRQGLIDQLSSDYGSKFTQEQAEYAADQVGL